MSTAVSPSPEVSSTDGADATGADVDAPAGASADASFTSPADKLRGRELDRQILALALPALGGLGQGQDLAVKFAPAQLVSRTGKGRVGASTTRSIGAMTGARGPGSTGATSG